METSVRDRVEKVLRSIFHEINGSFRDEWGPGEIEGWDSMNHLNLVMALGLEFEINLEFDEVMAIGVIGDIYTIFEKRGIK